MPHNLNISTVIDKNKVSSVNSFLTLLEVEVRDYTNVLVDTVRIVQNSEDIVFETNIYTATNFELDIQLDASKEPSITLKAHDETRQLGQYIDDYDGLIGSKVRVIIINSGTLTAPPEIDEDLVVLATSVSSYTANIELGMESSAAMRFPKARQFKDRCWKTFKSARCGYTGGVATCDYTRTGANGCIAKNNEINFGGFPGINELF